MYIAAILRLFSGWERRGEVTGNVYSIPLSV
jgi:hypothetical protein